MTTRRDRSSGRGAILVADGETRAALAAVRSLGRSGEEVHVLAERRSSLAGVSRYAAAEHVAPAARSQPREWLAAVLALLERLPGSALLPMTEISIGTILASDAANQARVWLPPARCYTTVIDKQTLLGLGARFGLRVPRTRLAETRRELGAQAEVIGIPAVIKPRRSRWLESGRWQEGRVRVAFQAEEFARVSDEELAAGVLVQEYVPGRGEGLFFLVSRGSVRARFAHRRLREKPPWGGVSVFSESIAPDPELTERCERLLEELGWDGVAMLEFRRTASGEAYLMELNPRFWGSLALAIDAGVDFPALLAAHFRGEDIQAPPARLGVRSRWLLGDLDHLLILARSARQRDVLRIRLGRALWRFCAAFFDGSRNDVLRWEDPRPFFSELGARLR